MPEAPVAEPPAPPVDNTPTPATETPTAPQSARGQYESRRDQLVAEADKDSLSADQFQELIGKADAAAKDSLVRIGAAKPEVKAPEAKAPEKPATPSETETLKGQIEAIKESTQKRIDELTAKLREAAQAPAKPAERTLQTISDQELDALWDKAEMKGFVVKDQETGEDAPDLALNAKVKRQVEAEKRRREREAEVEPVKAQAALKDAHDKSFTEVLKAYQKQLFKPVEKDGKSVLTYDEGSPVAKLAHEKMLSWAKTSPERFRMADAPMQAAKEAVAELGTGIDAEAAREIAKLRTENESLRTRLNMDGGSPGGGAPAPRPTDALGDNYADERRKAYLKSTGR